MEDRLFFVISDRLFDFLDRLIKFSLLQLELGQEEMVISERIGGVFPFGVEPGGLWVNPFQPLTAESCPSAQAPKREMQRKTVERSIARRHINILKITLFYSLVNILASRSLISDRI